MTPDRERSDENRVRVFDTTLRDGEQSPGISLNKAEKLEIAHQLARLGVDVIEAGFPISSPGDFEACRRIAREIRGATVTALARAVREDIDAVWGALKDAQDPQIHIVLSVSDVHIDRKLGMTRAQVLKRGAEMVEYARFLCDKVEYSPEDAGRADLAGTERSEAELISGYLPPELSEEQLQEIVAQAVRDTGATSERDMGRVMKQVMATVDGRADGKVVSGLVRASLQG